MSQIKATPEELRGHAQFVAGQVQTTQSNFNSLKSRLDQLHGQFEGQAAQAFDGRFQEWHTSGMRLIEALEALGKWLNNAAETIEQTDQQLASGLG
jgi:WXG100 family type VII secretion target